MVYLLAGKKLALALTPLNVGSTYQLKSGRGKTHQIRLYGLALDAQQDGFGRRAPRTAGRDPGD